MFNDTHGTRGQTSPPLGQAWQHRLWRWNKRGKLSVFLFLRVLHRRFVLSAQHILQGRWKNQEGFFQQRGAGLAKPAADSSKPGFHPDLSLLTIYLAWTAATSSAGLSGKLPAKQPLQVTHFWHQTSTPCPMELSPAAAGTPGLDGGSWQTSFSSLLLQQTLFRKEKTVTIPLAFLPATNLNSPAPGKKAAHRLSQQNSILPADTSFWKAKLEGVLQPVENSGWLKC